MKNISRRVFIKGMAVAAAATAASTVLAGCNLVPGTVEPEVVPGFQPETKTLSFEDDKSFTIGTTGFATAKKLYQSEYNDLAVVSLHLVNNMNDKVQVYNNAAGQNQLTVTAYLDGKGKTANIETTGHENNLYGNLLDSNSVTLETVVDGKLYFTIPEEQKDWKKMTLVFSLKNGTETETAEFVINNN